MILIIVVLFFLFIRSRQSLIVSTDLVDTLQRKVKKQKIGYIV